MDSIQWHLGNKTVTLQPTSHLPQVLVELEDTGNLTLHRAECSFSFHRIKSRDLLQALHDHFYPIVHRFSDGSFSVSFHTRGLGGGGVCCKEEDPVTRPLLQPVSGSAPGPLRVAQPAVAVLPPLRQADPPALAQKIQRMKETCQETFDEYEGTYIPAVERIGDQEVDLEQNVMQFLNSEQRVLLLNGDAGSGKSLFLECLASRLCQRYRPQDPIPLFISLPSLKNPVERCIEEALENAGFTPEEIGYLKASKSFIFLLDAYDELSIDQNLFVSNHLDQWRCKVVISCRSQYLPANYLDLFIPCFAGRSHPGLLREKCVAAFSGAQIDRYLKKRVERGGTNWKEWQDCKRHLDSIPGLAFLVQNPFVLSIVVQMLPQVLERYAKVEADDRGRLTRNEIYRLFLEQWFDRQQRKLAGDDLRKEFHEFSMRLAQKMHEKGVSRVFYDESLHLFDAEPSEWDPFFSSLDPQVTLIRSGCPLRKVGNQWSFIHATVLEFLVSEKLFEAMRHVPSQDADRRALMAQILANLNHRLIVEQNSIIQFSADRARAEPRFREALFEIVYLSAKDPQVAVAAANAITILAAAKIPFSRLDLSGIRIMGANLSGGIFDGTLFVGADLRRVQLADAFLKETVFTRALMEGVVLGQRPFISLRARVEHFALSRKWIAVVAGSKSGQIEIYDRNTLRLVKTLNTGFATDSAFGELISQLGFSPSGQFLVVSSMQASKAISPESPSSRYNIFPTLVFECAQWISKTLSGKGKYNSPFASGTFVFIGPFHVLSSKCVLERVGSIDMTSGKGEGVWDLRDATLVDSFESSLRVASPDHLYGARYESETNTISIRSLPRLKEVACIHLREKPKLNLNFIFSQDGSKLVYVTREGLAVYDIREKRVVKTIPSFPVILDNTPLAISPDGEEIAVYDHNSIAIWNLAIETEIAKIPNEGSVSNIYYSEDGQHLFYSSDLTVRVCEVALLKRKQQEEFVRLKDASISSDGTIACMDSNNLSCIRFWDGAAGQEQTAARINFRNYFFRLSPSGDRFLTRGAHVRLWDTATKSMIQEFPSLCAASNANANAFTISRGNRFLASTTVDGDRRSVHVWDLELNAVKHAVPLPSDFGAYNLEFSPDNTYLAIAATPPGGSIEKGFVQLLDLETGAVLEKIQVSTYPFVFSHDSKYLILSNKQNDICFYHIQKREMEFFLKAHQNGIYALAISPDGQLLASGDRRGKIFIFDLHTRQVVAGFTGHMQAVLELGFQHNGKKLVSHGVDKIIRGWDLYNASDEFDPRLQWASSPIFHTWEVRLNQVVGLSQENEAVFHQVTPFTEKAHPRYLRGILSSGRYFDDF